MAFDSGSLALLIPISAILGGVAIKIAKIQANARLGPRGGGEELTNRIAALEEEVGTIRQELSETHERLDFTERLLAQHRNTGLNPPQS